VSGTLVDDAVARWNGTTWTTLGNAAAGHVRGIDLAVFDDGAGRRSTARARSRGEPAHREWNGSTWSPLGTDIDDTATAARGVRRRRWGS
jgi:hypothetical protein